MPEPDPPITPLGYRSPGEPRTPAVPLRHIVAWAWLLLLPYVVRAVAALHHGLAWLTEYFALPSPGTSVVISHLMFFCAAASLAVPLRTRIGLVSFVTLASALPAAFHFSLDLRPSEGWILWAYALMFAVLAAVLWPPALLFDRVLHRRALRHP